MKALWALIPFPWQMAIEFGGVAVICIGLMLVHHHIWQEGYDAAMVKVQAEAAKRDAQSRKDITSIGEAHEKIRQTIRAQGGYAAPASPLVSQRIAGLRKDGHSPAKRFRAGMQSAFAATKHN